MISHKSIFGGFQLDTSKLRFFYIALVIIIIFPFVCTIPFAVPLQDDFMMYRRLMQEGSGIILVDALKATFTMYFDWTGGIPWIFAEFLFNPLNYSESYSFLTGLFLTASFLVFVIVLHYYLDLVLSSYFMLNDFWKKASFIVLLSTILNSGVYREIFYWYVGCVYLWVYIMGMITHMLMISYFKCSENKIIRVAFTVVGFFTCFNYQIAVALGLLYVIEMYKFYKNNGNLIQFRKFVPLGFMILGGIISVLAPGNFVRLEDYTNLTFSFPKVIYDTYLLVKYSAFLVLTNPLYIASVCIYIVIGFCKVKREKRLIHPFVAVVFFAAATIGMAFPVAFGQGNSALYNRMEFFLNTCICIGTMFCAVLLGEWVRSFVGDGHSWIEKCRTHTLVCAVCCFFSLVLCIPKSDGVSFFRDLPWTYTLEHAEKYRSEMQQVRELYVCLSEAEGEYTVDYKNFDITTKMMPGLLYGDENFWVNVETAYYFGLDGLDCRYS